MCVCVCMCCVSRRIAICIYLQVPDYAPFSWRAMRSDTYLSRRCFTLTSAETPRSFFARDIMSGSVTRASVAGFFFRHVGVYIDTLRAIRVLIIPGDRCSKRDDSTRSV